MANNWVRFGFQRVKLYEKLFSYHEEKAQKRKELLKHFFWLPSCAKWDIDPMHIDESYFHISSLSKRCLAN